jgi:hypothetical protein
MTKSGESNSQKQPGSLPNDPLSLYTPILMLALMGVFALQFSVSRVMPALGVLFAPLYTWVLAGLGVCTLLYLWLRARRAAIVVSAVLALIWLVGLVRYAQGQNLLSQVLIVILTVGIPVLIVLSFTRPFDGILVGLLGVGWLLLWIFLLVILREFLAGLALLLSLLTGGAVFLLGLYIASGLLLPVDDTKKHRATVLKFLRDHMIKVNRPAYVVVSELHEEDKVEKRISGSSFSQLATAPGFVISDCDHAVVISAGTRFKGVQGPGVAFTRFADQVVQVVDLRPHLRAFPVDAMTKDGIRVRVWTATACKIDAGGKQPALGEPLPYNKSAAFKAFHAHRAEHEGNQTKQLMWYDLPRVFAERALQNIISEYSFDDLYGPYSAGDPPPRVEIADRFRERVGAELEPLGIHFVGGGISEVEAVDPEVYVKRVESWKTEWDRKIMLRQAEGQAEWLRIVERARAEAQTDLILELGRQLEEMSTARTEFRPERVLEQLVIVLDQMMGEPALKSILPEETLRGIMYIRDAFTD